MTTKQKNTFFCPINGENSAQKRKKEKNCQNPFKAIIKLKKKEKKKWLGPLSQ